MQAAKPGRKFVGLYGESHLEYELDRTAVPPRGEGAKQPSLSEMTAKAIELLSPNPKGFFLMVEGGKIDHALHGSNAKRAVADLMAFDDAIQTAIDTMRALDPGLRNTLIVITADHDHTLAFNGNAARGNSVLDIVRGADGQPAKDADGHSYTTLTFGNGPNRKPQRTELGSQEVQADDYQQETGLRLRGETHGGGDVKLYAVGAGSAAFKGTMENTQVFHLMKAAYGF
jgi:alkaline phosphatase